MQAAGWPVLLFMLPCEAPLRVGISTFCRLRALSLALGIGLFYAILGTVWILVSDALVQSMSSEPGWLSLAQRYKGLTYVWVSAAGLVLLVWVGNRRLLAAIDRQHASELQVQDMFEQHPQPMWVLAPRTHAFLKVNQAAVRQYGYTEAEFLGMTLADILPAEERARLQASDGVPMDARTDLGVLRHRRKSAEVIQVHVLTQPVSFGGGAAMMAMMLDMTEVEQARLALERQEAQFRQLHQSLGEVLWLASADGSEMLYVSPAFEQLYGVSSEAFIKAPHLWADLVHPEDRAMAEASTRRLQVEGAVRCEYRICRPDGSVRWVADRKKVIVDEQGQVQMIGGIAEDITRTKDAEAALRAQSEELALRNSELERFNKASVNRELDMIRLKEEVNRLSQELDRPAPYPLAFADAPTPRDGAHP